MMMTRDFEGRKHIGQQEYMHKTQWWKGNLQSSSHENSKNYDGRKLEKIQEEGLSLMRL